MINTDGIIKVALAIVGLAITAVLVSNNASTSKLISASGTAFANVLKAAVGPVSGGSGIISI